MKFFLGGGGLGQLEFLVEGKKMSSASSTRDQIGMHGCFSELGIGIVEYREVSALFFVIWGGLSNILCYDLLLCILYTLPPPDIRAHCRQTGIPWSGADCELSSAHRRAQQPTIQLNELKMKTGNSKIKLDVLLPLVTVSESSLNIPLVSRMTVAYPDVVRC